MWWNWHKSDRPDVLAVITIIHIACPGPRLSGRRTHGIGLAPATVEGDG